MCHLGLPFFCHIYNHLPSPFIKLEDIGILVFKSVVGIRLK